MLGSFIHPKPNGSSRALVMQVFTTEYKAPIEPLHGLQVSRAGESLNLVADTDQTGRSPPPKITLPSIMCNGTGSALTPDSASDPISDASSDLNLNSMTASTFISNVCVTTHANIYFDGICVSHTITLADGTRKSVGVILPATLRFNTGAAEVMECVAGWCDYKLAGSQAWVKSSAGQSFNVPANSSFEIRALEPYHYVCHFA